MYATERWSPRLRQGDVVGPAFLPLLGTKFETIGSSQSLTDVGPDKVDRMIVRGKHHLLAVVSHDCEFNEGKRQQLLVARLQPIPGNVSDDDREALRASNDVESRASSGDTVAGVDSFVYAPLDGVLDREHIAVFTSTTPLPMQMRGEFTRAKKAELCQEHRELFRSKLAWFFGRTGDDLSDAEKVDPPQAGRAFEP